MFEMPPDFAYATSKLAAAQSEAVGRLGGRPVCCDRLADLLSLWLELLDGFAYIDRELAQFLSTTRMAAVPPVVRLVRHGVAFVTGPAAETNRRKRDRGPTALSAAAPALEQVHRMVVRHKTDVCRPATTAPVVPPAATNQNYYPEWIFSSFGGNDTTAVIQAFWPDVRQRQAIVGVGTQPPMRPIDEEPAWWALQEVDPEANVRADSGVINEFTIQYRAMLTMASGIQMAGPTLTPATFQAALHRTAFPNATDYPDPADPLKSGNVGFLDGDHSMIDDAVEYWWSEAATSPVGFQSNGAPGALCYLDRADRRVVGRWPAGKDPFGGTSCYTGA